MASTSAPPLGNLLRSTPISLSELPSHPSLSALQTSSNTQPLSTFLQAFLNEGLTFSEETIPSTFTGSSTKSAKPATASVLVQKRVISNSELQRIPWTTGAYPRSAPPSSYVSAGETWFMRSSTHENAAKAGTFSWREADEGLRLNHSENECAYTPDCYDARLVLEWADAKTMNLDGFEDVTMRIFEMCHHINPPVIENRAFSTLVATAKTGDAGLLVVQMPVDITKYEGAWYVLQKQTREGIKGDKGRKVVVGVYTSVERVKVLQNGKINWVMATASDAKGMIPMWMQSMGLPGAITKDVGLFAKFCQERRNGKQSSS